MNVCSSRPWASDDRWCRAVRSCESGLAVHEPVSTLPVLGLLTMSKSPPAIEMQLSSSLQLPVLLQTFMGPSPVPGPDLTVPTHGFMCPEERKQDSLLRGRAGDGLQAQVWGPCSDYVAVI